MTEYDIFLSYASKDEKIMELVRSEFERAGLTVWTMQGIPLGAPSWKAEIEKGIRASKCLVPIFSPYAKASEWCQAELDYAKALKKKIFPILAGGEDFTDAVPIDFTRAQWIDIRPKPDPAEPESFQNKTEPDLKPLPRLTKALQTFVGAPPSPPQLDNIPSSPMKRKAASKTIFVSAPFSQSLTKEQLEVKERLLSLLVGADFEPLLIGEVGKGRKMTWTFDGVIEIMSDCVGAVMLGLARWEFNTVDSTYRFATEYTHFEGALALASELPTLIIKEDGVSERGIFYTGGGRFIITLPPSGAEKWMEYGEFRDRFEDWCAAVREFMKR